MNSQDSPPSAITHQDIADRAHAIWEREGCPAGRELDHWLQAEQELHSECSDEGNLESKFQHTGAASVSRRRAAGSSGSGRIAKSG
jgi:hypothetical protein